MVSAWALALVLPAVLVAAGNWRTGLYAMLVVVFLQDPARKLDPEQPVYFTLLAGIVLAMSYIRAQHPKHFSLGGVTGWNRYLRGPSILLALLLVVQAGISIVRYENPIIAGIGMISYLAPLPAMLLGYHFALKLGPGGVQRWLGFYLILALIALPSIALEYAGVEWATLGQVGEGFEMYQGGEILTAHSGFFRASETAAWHVATAVCILLLLSSMRKLVARHVAISVLVVVLLMTLGVLTGRRKIFVEIVIFVSTYVALLLLFGKGGLRMALAVFLGGLLCYGASAWWGSEEAIPVAGENAVAYQHYAERSATVASGVSDRFQGLGLTPVIWAIDRFGWLGGGLGVASQGAQHFGGGGEIFGGAGEGGLGKITAELGVPGLVIALWFAIAAFRQGWHVLVYVSHRSNAVARLAYGMIALLVANLAVFTVATQVFGDVSVLVILGLMMGFFLATPLLAERERLRRPIPQGNVHVSRPTVSVGVGGGHRGR